MMRLFVLFCFGLLLVLPGRAQERVRHVRVSVVDSSQLEIRYDLASVSPGDSVYFEIRSRLRGALRILPEFVRGDIGTRITAGPEQRIVWNALANGYSLNEEIRATVFVKAGPPVAPAQQPTPPKPTVAQKTTRPNPPLDSTSLKPKPSEAVAVTKPATPEVPQQPKSGQPAATAPPTQQPNRPAESVVQSTQPPPATAPVDSIRPRVKTRYAGPAWALLSAVAPGIGNIFVQLPKPKVGLRPVVTVVSYGLVAYGLIERQKSRDELAVYEQQKNATAGEPYYQTANDHHHRYFLATRGAMVIAAADVILTLVKGIRSSQLMKEARRNQGFTIRPGLQLGQPTAVVRYSF